MRVAAAITFGAALAVAGASGAASERVPDRLAWAPPALSNPLTVSVTNANSRLFLDDSRDYRLTLAEPLKRELWIEGGRNVVVIGGQITIDQLGGGDSYQDNTALKIRYGAAGGTVHVEGLLIDGPYLADGIALATPRNVQIENVRVERTYNNIKGAHADCVQIQQGVGQLRMDRFTCTTEHQGVFLDGSIGGVDLRRVNLHGAPGRHLLWQTTPTFDIALTSVRLDINPQYQPWAPFGFWVYPQRDGRTYVGVVDRKRHAVVSRDGKRLWFVGSRISGVVRHAPAGARDFVPLGGSGPGYVSPGYVRGSGS